VEDEPHADDKSWHQVSSTHNSCYGRSLPSSLACDRCIHPAFTLPKTPCFLHHIHSPEHHAMPRQREDRDSGHHVPPSGDQSLRVRAIRAAVGTGS
jgi:hypothetical protein